MRYCDGMYLSLKEAASSRMLMGALREDIMQGEKSRRRFYAQGCGGQPFIRIQKNIARRVTYVKERAGHHEGRKFL